MIKYEAVSNDLTGTVINAVENGNRVPVATVFALEEGFPFEAGRMAQNFVSLLNGRDPIHPVANEGHEIYYSRLSETLQLHWKEEGVAGVSTPGLVIAINSGAKDFGEDMMARVTPEFMKSFCDAVMLPDAGHTPQGSPTSRSPAPQI